MVNGDLAVLVRGQLRICFLYVTAAAPGRLGLAGATRTSHVNNGFNDTKHVQCHVRKVREEVERSSERDKTYISVVEVV